MKRSIQSGIAIALLAIGTFGAAAVAHAATTVHLSVNLPGAVYVPAPARVVHQPVYEADEPVLHVPPHRAYPPAPRHAREGWRGHERGWRSACGARPWNPTVRYMPGQAVWRKGTLYVATRLSASVYNENSPPEWTPRYWVPAACA